MIQLLERTVDILDFVARGKEPVRLPAIAKATGLKTATCANIISSLSESGLLEKRGTPRRFEYVIGPKIYEYATVGSSWSQLKRIASRPLDEFAAETGASLILAILDGEERVIIHEAWPTSSLQVHHHERILAYASDMGRFLLAHLNEQEIDKFIAKYRLPDAGSWPEVTSQAILGRALKDIRNNGSKPVINNDHIVTLLAPIKVGGRLVAGLGGYLPYNYYDENGMVKLEENFSKISAKLSAACEERQV